MNNLVIGSSGFVGKYLCQYLLNKREGVIEYDIVRDSQEDARFAKLPLENIDRVYFLAWKVGGANYLYDPATQKEQLEWNLQLLSNVMSQLTNIPFVFVSSQLAEDCNMVYGILKRLGEVWTQLNGGRVIRLWNIYGAYEPHSIKSHVVADFIHQALSNKKIIMLTDGEEQRQFIYIEDACDVLHSSFDHHGIYDASSTKWNSVNEVASLISKYTGCAVVRGKKRGSSLIITNKPLIKSTPTSLDEGIQKTVKLFKQANEYQ
jgi:nucleoside-diphosphate-sugar epimerase